MPYYDWATNNACHIITMKRIILSLIVLLVLCATCSLITYHFGYRSGFDRAKVLQERTLAEPSKAKASMKRSSPES